jgi:nicotinamide mononucleotide transporter
VTLLTHLWEGLQDTSPLEWIANATGVTYALLVMRHKRLGWVLGGISSGILTLLAWRARLPMQALLQFSYVVAAVYGWWSWSRTGGVRPISLWHWRGHLAVLVACLVTSLILSRVLAGESAFPFADSLVFCLGMFATWLLARVHLENWGYWIVIDTVSIYLFVAQGMAAVALLFLIYMGISIAGFVQWLRTWRAHRA